MTSSQYDPRPGQDDTIGGDARDVVGKIEFKISDIVGDIFDFNEQVIKTPLTLELNALTKKQYDWIQQFCAEELRELHEAYILQDIVKMTDAVLDLIYGALGTLKKMGLTRQQVYACFDAIHAANMTKEKGVVATRGGDEDAAKPDDFVPPDEAIGHILFGGQS